MRHNWTPEDDVIAFYLYRCESKSESHYAPHKSKPVYEQYKNASCDSLRSEVIRILGR
jgi:hypothetical protein